MSGEEEAEDAPVGPPPALAWLVDARPAYCPAGHMMVWTEMHNPPTASMVVAGDHVEVNVALVAESHKACNLPVHKWMTRLQGKVGVVTRGSGAEGLPPDTAEVHFEGVRNRKACFSLGLLRQRLRPGDAVQSICKLTNASVEKGTVGFVDSTTGGVLRVRFGDTVVEPESEQAVHLVQRWRCGSPECAGGHIASGLWRWRCGKCSLDLCCMCRDPPPPPIRRFLNDIPTQNEGISPDDAATQIISGVDCASQDPTVPRVGDWVRVRHGIVPYYGWGDVEPTDIGVVVSTASSDCTVHFPCAPAPWKGRLSELDAIRPGDRVRVRPDVSNPKYGWGSVRHGDTGHLLSISVTGDCTVEFGVSRAPWEGNVMELDIIKLVVGDAVAVRRAVREPSFGWGGVAHGDIGIVTGFEDSSVVIVKFAVAATWRCLPHEIEVVGRGAAVQVHPEVTVPRGDWRGVSRGDVGTVASVSSGGECTVSFPAAKTWTGNLMDMELLDAKQWSNGRRSPLTKNSPLGPPLPVDKTINDEDKLKSLDAVKTAAVAGGGRNTGRRAAYERMREHLIRVYAAWDQNLSMQSIYNNLYLWVFVEFAKLAVGDHVVLSQEGAALVKKKDRWKGLREGEEGKVDDVDAGSPWFVQVRTPSGKVVAHLRQHVVSSSSSAPPHGISSAASSPTPTE